MKSAPESARSMPTTRSASRSTRLISIAPVTSSANVASPSCAPRLSDLNTAWLLPFSAVRLWTNASCCSSWSRSCAEKPVAPRKRIRVAPAAALEAMRGSISTRILPGSNTAVRRWSSSWARISAGRQQSASLQAGYAVVLRTHFQKMRCRLQPVDVSTRNGVTRRAIQRLAVGRDFPGARRLQQLT